MKRELTPLISGLMIALSLMLSGNRLRAQAGVANTVPLDVTVSLTGSSTVSIGEPILLKYVVKNVSSQKASVYTADTKHTAIITECFTDADGKPLAPSVNPIPTHHRANMMTSWDGIEVAGGTSTSWEAVANAYVTFPRPGTYVLRVHMQNPYVIGDVSQGTHHILGGDYVFPLTVVEANPAHLYATAERLRQSILPTLDVNARATLIKALFSMPEATAGTSWQALVEEPRLDGYALSQITTALARIHTTRAADILAELVWEPAQANRAIQEASPSQHLYEMYDTGDAALRKHIEDLHKQHGAEMSHFRIE